MSRFLALLLMMFSILLVQKYLSVYVLLPFIFCFAIWFWIKKQPLLQAMLGITVACIGSDIVVYLYCILLILFLLGQIIQSKRIKMSFIGPEALLLLFLAFGFGSYMFSHFYDFDLASYWLFLLTFGALTGPFFYFIRYQLMREERKKVLNFMLTIVLIQCLISVADYILPVLILGIGDTPVTPDLVKGTLGTANDFAYLCFLVLVINFNFLYTLRISMQNRFMLSFILCIALLASAKTQLFSLILTLGILITVLHYFIHHYNKRVLSIISLVMMGGFLILGIPRLGDVYEKYEEYISGKFNNKAVYYSRALNGQSRSLAQYFIGTGPGTCGSRVANARAYDVLYKKESSFKLHPFMKPHSSIYTKEILADIWTVEYAKSSPIRSALLGNPFNSIVAIFIEFGMLGFFLFLSLFFFIIKLSIKTMNQQVASFADKNAAFGLLMLTGVVFISAFIDQILERGTMMYLFWFMVAFVASAFRDNRSQQMR